MRFSWKKKKGKKAGNMKQDTLRFLIRGNKILIKDHRLIIHTSNSGTKALVHVTDQFHPVHFSEEKKRKESQKYEIGYITFDNPRKQNISIRKLIKNHRLIVHTSKKDANSGAKVFLKEKEKKKRKRKI